ncbi:MAG: D-aminoacylase [Alphaproteobacteria bacterium]|nr:D-aminoacylase [Alphaproteobacteria bacterium]
MATHDIVIRGGLVVDGTGAKPFEGDVAITGEKIAAMGRIDGNGRREIDAKGCVVSPGFVDLHTHLDAQIGWDPDLTPVSWHGVTTVLMGNCGVTFAPCKAEDRGLLAGMMEAVEDIPRDAIMNGLPWDWETYGDYLSSIERLNPRLNVAGMIGHCALRFYVMGERAVEENATEQEKQQMADLVGRSIDDGAVGFSTNRFEPHKLPDGRSIPGTFAEPDELMRIAKAVGARGGVMQSVGASLDLMCDLAANSGARMLFSAGVGADANAGRYGTELLKNACKDGIDLTGISQPRGSGFIFGLQSNLPAKGSSWLKLQKLDLAGRLKAISDPATRATLVDDAKKNGTGWLKMETSYWMGDGEVPDYLYNKSLQDWATEAGEHWSEAFFRVSLQSEGRALFNYRMYNLDLDSLADLFSGPRFLPSLGDAGAHVSQIMDAGWATFVLSYWVRERGLYTIEEGIRRITSAPARVIGLTDRGILAPGMCADVNVFDPDQVTELAPVLVHDFPGGAPRFIQRARGYKATLVNGRMSTEDGESVGDRSGRVLRKSRAASNRP